MIKFMRRFGLIWHIERAAQLLNEQWDVYERLIER